MNDGSKFGHSGGFRFMLAVLIMLAQPAAAFITLDLCFRLMSVDPDRLAARRWSDQWSYSAVGAIVVLAGGFGQWLLAGWWGAAAALVGWVPWWLLWRFGWRKQFTYLFKNDGGKARK